MRVVRIYHAGRDAAHRERDRALVAAGVEVTLVVPAAWDDAGGQARLGDEPFEVVELPVLRSGDVNRHRFADAAAVAGVVARVRPDVVDLAEEPVAAVTRQVLRALDPGLPVVGYTAQNLDKRWPPPFAQWESAALRRLQGIYPCSRQAASVVVGKGFTGAVRVLPLAPSGVMTAGDQQPPAADVAMLLVGRLVPEKGVLDAVDVLAALRRTGVGSLTVVGSGPLADAARDRAAAAGVGRWLEVLPWLPAEPLAGRYRAAHVLLAPSRATATWVEQFGRVVVEARATGAVVVGYGSGSLPEVVGDAGVLVPEGDVDALAAAVLALAQDPARWSALRERGFELAARESWSAVADGLAELYAAVAAGGGGRRGRARPDRDGAVARFGPPARAHGAARPFAAPVLRRDSAGTRALGRAVDLVARGR